ncbi:filamentous hemagglutinin family protein [Oxalobacteraceae bacterium GrIS 2.11]
MNRHGSLNRIYRLVWSQVTNSWVAVAETAKGKGKGKSQRRKLIATALALAAISGAIPAAMAVNVAANLPVLNPTIKGSGSVVVTSGAVGMTITQATQNALLNWNSFNVGEHNFVNFVQPNASSVTVNNILDNNPSTILGSVHANGSIFLINPNGMVFGPHARVNVGGLVVSALAMNGSGSAYKFSGSGSVDNQGTINTGSYVVLLGSSVTNEGTITAPLGNIILGAGNQATMKLNSSTGTVSLNIDKSTLKNLVANGGVIIADGGHIIMTAGARNELVASAVNNNGVLQARTVGVNKGTISLLADKEGGALGGTVTVGGTIDASAPDGGDGGAVETSAGTVKMAPQFAVLTHAGKGHHGSWLIDPVDFNIGANALNGETSDISGANLGAALANSDITIQTSGSPPCTNVSCGSGSGSLGNINVNDAVSWSSGHALTLNADNNINVYRPISVNGAGTLNLWYGQQSAAGSGALNIYSPINLASNSTITTQLGSNPANLINNYHIINGLGAQGSTTGNDLQGINGNLTGNYVLGSDIDASATASWNQTGTNTYAGFVPLGTAQTFSGIFNGLGHTVSGLYINRPVGFTGLFAVTGPGSTISNVALTAETVNGLYSKAGGLAGYGQGTFINDSASATVSGTYGLGGLIGVTNNATITSCHASGEVLFSNTVAFNNTGVTSDGGGLVGYMRNGTISHSYATTNIVGANVSSNGSQYLGGLVGETFGTSINTSYATGAIIAPTGFYLGGLVGFFSSGSVTNSYATGPVSGSYGVGGLVGTNQGTISTSYATGSVTASQPYSAGGLVGVNLGSVDTSYSIGPVTAPSAGGLAGTNGGTISHSYFDISINPGLPLTGNLSTAVDSFSQGLSTAQMQDGSSTSNLKGFNFVNAITPGTGNNWVIVDADGTLNGTNGATYPILASEYATNITNPHQLQLMALAPAASYTLANNIDAGNTKPAGTVNLDVWGAGGFAPVGSTAQPFTGSLNGQGYTISNMTINQPTGTNVGLFGNTRSSMISNVALVNSTVTGLHAAGTLIGNNNGGTITYSSATGGGVSANNPNSGRITGNVGGLIGNDTNGNISYSFADVPVTAKNYAGGLVGYASGTTIDHSHAGMPGGGLMY